MRVIASSGKKRRASRDANSRGESGLYHLFKLSEGDKEMMSTSLCQALKGTNGSWVAVSSLLDLYAENSGCIFPIPSQRTPLDNHRHPLFMRSSPTPLIVICLMQLTHAFEIEIRDMSDLNACFVRKKLDHTVPVPVEFSDDLRIALERIGMSSLDHQLESEALCLLWKAVFSQLASKYRSMLEMSHSFMGSRSLAVIEGKLKAMQTSSAEMKVLQDKMDKLSLDRCGVIISALIDEVEELRKRIDELVGKLEETSIPLDISENISHISNDAEMSKLRVALREKEERIRKLESCQISLEQDGPVQVEDTFKSTKDTPRGVIESIRKEKGVGITVPSGIRACLTDLHRTLDNAIEKIAMDIYSQKTSFVSELIQNADDNSYSQQPLPPSFEIFFDFDLQQVVTRNNEDGFSEKDIRALCSIGDSTKVKKGASKTGHKGIGFKSVFAVSDTPQIKSNGFSFGFNTRSQLGFITPSWISSETNEEGTVIILPFGDGSGRASAPTLEDFDEVYCRVDHILLFLRSLQHIKFSVTNNGTTQSKSLSIYREILKSHEIDHITIESGTETITRSFIVIRKSFKIPQHLAPRHLENRAVDGFIDTEIALAFPKWECDSSFPICSFLPVCDEGFKFIIHGEFDLVSSREQIHKSSVWNRCIRNEIPSLFFQAMRISSIDLLDKVPMDITVFDAFWAPMARTIREYVLNIPCIVGASGNMRKPSEIVKLPVGLGLGDVWFDSDALWRCVQKEWMHPSMSGNPVLEHMNFRMLDPFDCISVYLSMGSGNASSAIRLFHFYSNRQVLSQFEKQREQSVDLMELAFIEAVSTLSLWSIDHQDPIAFNQGPIYTEHFEDFVLPQFKVYSDSSEEGKALLVRLGGRALNSKDITEGLEQFHAELLLSDESISVKDCLEHIRFLESMQINDLAWLAIPSLSGKCYPARSLYAHSDVIQQIFPASLIAAIDIPQMHQRLGTQLLPLVGSPEFELMLQWADTHPKPFFAYIVHHWCPDIAFIAKIVLEKGIALPSTKPEYSNLFTKSFQSTFGDSLAFLDFALEDEEILDAFEVHREITAVSIRALESELTSEDDLLSFYKLVEEHKMGSMLHSVTIEGTKKTKNTLIFDGDEDIASILSLTPVKPRLGHLEELFLKQMCILPSFSFAQVKRALNIIARKPPQGDLTSLLAKLYRNLEQMMVSEGVLQVRIPILSQDRGFCTTETVFVSDDDELGRCWYGKVPFAHPIVSEHPVLCERAGVKAISSLVRSDELKALKSDDFLTEKYKSALSHLKRSLGDLIDEQLLFRFEELQSSLQVYFSATLSLSMGHNGIHRNASKQFHISSHKLFTTCRNIQSEALFHLLYKKVTTSILHGILSSFSTTEHSLPIEITSTPMPSTNSSPLKISTDTQEITDWVGREAEYFAFQTLIEWSKRFNHHSGRSVALSHLNWVSSARSHYFPEDDRNIDDTLGYDLFVEDPGGFLDPSNPHPTTWLIEVKGNMQKKARFILSSNEWEQAQRCVDGRMFRYLIFGVSMQPSPQLSFWLDNPVKMVQLKQITLKPKEFNASSFQMLN